MADKNNAVATMTTSQIAMQDAMTPLGEWLPLAEQQAKYLIQSNYFGKSVTTVSQGVTIMMKARELAIPVTYAMTHMYVVDGKLSMGAELMLAVIHRDHGQQAMRVKESDAKKCTVEYRMPGWDGVRTITWTIEQAQKAKLTGKDNWVKYPEAMLRSRAISAAARISYPGSLGGMYTPDELGSSDVIDVDGEIRSTASVSIDDPEVSADPEKGSSTEVDGRFVDVESGEVTDTQPSEPKSAPVGDIEQQDMLQLVYGTFKWRQEDVRAVVHDRFGADAEIGTIGPDDMNELYQFLVTTDAAQRETLLESIKVANTATQPNLEQQPA